MYSRAISLFALFALLLSISAIASASPIMEERGCRAACKFVEPDATSSIDFASVVPTSEATLEPEITASAVSEVSAPAVATSTPEIAEPTSDSVPVAPDANVLKTSGGLPSISSPVFAPTIALGLVASSFMLFV